MAKTSMVMREKKRARTVAKYAAKRAKLKEIISSSKTSDEEKWEAAARCQPVAWPAPLSGDRSSPWCVSQVWPVSQQIAGSRYAR